MPDIVALVHELEALHGAHQGVDRRLAIEVFGFRRNESSAWPWRSPYGKALRSTVPPYTADARTIASAIGQRWPGYGINASWSADSAAVELFAGPPLVAEAKAATLAVALCLAAARLAAQEAEAAAHA